MTFHTGSTTADGTEQTVVDNTADRHYALHLFTNNMASGDTLEVRIYTYDTTGTTQRQMDLIPLYGAQTSPAYYLPYITDEKYKVTIKQTTGTNRVYNWKWIDVT